MALTVGMDYARRPEPSWQAMLDQLTPPEAPHVGRLVVAWEPGDAWQPIHRWVIWQVQPWAHVDPTIRRILLGPSPRKDARLQYVRMTVNGADYLSPRVKGPYSNPFVDYRTWALARDLRREGIIGYPRRFWLVQGDDGGRPFAVADEEAMLREAQGLPPYPGIGDAPYAVPDQRTVRAIERRDLWRWANRLGVPETAKAAAAIARLTDAEREARRLQWATQEQIATELADFGQWAARKDLAHYHRPHKGPEMSEEQYAMARAAYIGNTNYETEAVA